MAAATGPATPRCCTYALTGPGLVHQRVFECFTCGLTGDQGYGLCDGCCNACHAGHDVAYLAFGRCYCDCGARGCPLVRSTEPVRLAYPIVTDEHGRLAGAASLNRAFGAWQTDLGSRAWHDELLAQCAAYAAARAAGLPTFWLACEDTPRSLAEGVVASILTHHVRGTPSGDRGAIGAEWWVQDMATDVAHADGLTFHYDKDETLAEVGIGLWPALATVTYLSTCAAMPTVVLGATAADPEGSPIPEAVVSFPEVGKHIAFDGMLLHGVPGRDVVAFTRHGAGEAPRRLSLLVNIWIGFRPALVQPAPLLPGVAWGEATPPPTQLTFTELPVAAVNAGAGAWHTGVHVELPFVDGGLHVGMWVPREVAVHSTSRITFAESGQCSARIVDVDAGEEHGEEAEEDDLSEGTTRHPENRFHS